MTTIQDAIKNLQERIAHEQSRIKFLRETYPAESEGFALAQQTIARCYGAIQGMDHAISLMQDIGSDTPIAQPTEASEPAIAEPTPAPKQFDRDELLIVNTIKLTEAQTTAIRAIADDPKAKVNGRAKKALSDKGLVDANGLTRKGRAWLHARTNCVTKARKAEIVIGGHYLKNVSGSRTVIRITRANGNGWEGVNLKTNRAIHIKSASGLTIIPEAKLADYRSIYAAA